MSEPLYVSVDLDGETVPAGTLFVTERRGSVTSVFTYDPDYLGHARAFALDPQLPLITGAQVTSPGLPGALSDCSPDRWGRNLIRKDRMGGQQAASAFVGEYDYLVGVSDLTRQGALRISTARNGPYLAEGTRVPPLIELARLRRAAWSVAIEDNPEGIRELLQAGTASLGGARPKASVRDGEDLHLAKFAHPLDEFDQVRFEGIALDMAGLAGVDTPDHALLTVDDQSVLVVKRFDRRGPERIAYLSAMSLMGLQDGDNADYVTFGDALRTHSTKPQRDLTELWRRMVFGVAVNNLDDHPRNHGLLRGKAGWALSPIFDVTPDPHVGIRAMSMTSSHSPEDCVVALGDIGSSWHIPVSDQQAIVRQVLSATSQWASLSRRHGASGAAVSTMGDVMAHLGQLIARQFSLES